MKYKYITVKEVGEYDGKPFYHIVNNRQKLWLGSIRWDSQWRQYIAIIEPANSGFPLYRFDATSIFSASCLRDIIDFIDNHAGVE